ncbi:conserved membrane hypothetical protein [Flavobacterium sp. 9R]|uniref:hypothetical protein n=1 Tax=Flavobacterium sp. 9R TaxID=2653143 RepID=UPI0012F081A2|nr:hypothetical protein [Flavobacterium sp. 9R]VXB67766.1 conserved membrane hypothetical protein [Flavobacterium sp. 9R]
MKELDLLKKDWQKNEASFEQVTEKDIYKMIHKKSSSIVKWILILSVLELVFWFVIGLGINIDDDFKRMNHEEFSLYFKIYDNFNYLILLTFIYLFYKNYKIISTTVSTKQLMRDIIKTRKTVNYYVYYNLGQIVVLFFIFTFISFKYNPDSVKLANQIGDNYGMLAFTFLFLLTFILIIFGLFWLFYRIVYGRLLKRLLDNYKELKKIDL